MTPDEIKERVTLVEYLERQGLQGRKVGREVAFLCPFHEERTGSFHVSPEKRVFLCRGCGVKGTIIDFVMLRDGVDFKEACSRLGGAPLLSIAPTIRKPMKRAREPWVPYFPTDEQKAWARVRSYTLAENVDLCQSIAADRKWLTGTIRQLASEGVLGWNHGAGEICFVYETGVKAREWRNGTGRRFRWAYGKGCLWRSNLPTGSSTRIVITEGETDAITLIDTGVETDGTIRVLALPSASTFHEDWAVLMRGRDVFIALDADSPGEQAAERVAAILRPVAKSVAILNWEGVNAWV